MNNFYRVLNLGQAQKTALSQELRDQWLSKIDVSMGEVEKIQDWVKSHPEEARSVGLDRDVLNLPPSSDVASYPKLAGIVAALKSGEPIDTTELQCVESLMVAVKAANEKIDAFSGGFVNFAKSPLGIAIGAGIVALGVGLVVSS